MPLHDPTIAELIRDGFADLRVHCEQCRFVVIVPFAKVLGERAPWRVRLGQISPKLRCSKCGNPPRSVEPRPKETYGKYGHSQ